MTYLTGSGPICQHLQGVKVLALRLVWSELEEPPGISIASAAPAIVRPVDGGVSVRPFSL
jgi:hypothetical protein